MKFKFTDTAIRRFKLPPDKMQETLLQGKGGRCLGMWYGRKKQTWFVMWYQGKKSPTKSLGQWPHMKTKAALEALRTFDIKKAEAVAQTGSFAEVAAEWLKRDVVGRGLRSAKEIERHLDRYVLQRWGKLPFAEIDRETVAKLLDKIADDHGPTQSNAVLGTLSKLFNWKQARSSTYVSPVVRGMKVHKPAPRKRALNDDEIRALWKAAGEVNGTFGALVKTLLLTGQRREKVVTMKWSDLSDDCAEWVIASEAREKGNAGAISLPPMLTALLTARPRIVGNPFVFAGRGEGPFNSFSQRKAELDAKLPGMPPWVLHDLRRTARQLLSRIEINTEIAERVLGHVIGGVQGVYDHASAYRARVDQALARLAAEIERIISGEPEGKVVALRR